MKTWYCLAGLGLAAAFLGIYFAVACTVGFGPQNESWDAYGEVPVAGPVKQPVAFWTDLGFIAAGLLMLLWMDLSDGSTAPGAMSAATALSVPLGLLMVWMGPASMLEHGTLNATWGWFDASSIHWYALYVVGFVVLRWVPGGDRSWAGRGIFWGAFTAAAVAIGVWTRLDGRASFPMSVTLLVLLVVALIVSVVLERTGTVGYVRPWDLWTLPSAGVLLIAGIAFLLTSTRGSSIAHFGHGIWHLCVAGAALFVWLYLRSERAGA
jgi:hypothetical protein